MIPCADIIRLFLIDDGLGAVGTGEDGTLYDWSVYTGFLPSELDRAIAVYDTAGKLDGRIMLTGEQVEHPGIQIRVRGPDYTETFTRVQDIAEYLDTIRNEVKEMTGVLYEVKNVSRTGAIMPMGIEEGDRIRHHFTVNAVLTIRKK